MHLIVDVIHNIHTPVLITIRVLHNVVGMKEQVAQRGHHIVIVATTWRNVLTEDAHKDVI